MKINGELKIFLDLIVEDSFFAIIITIGIISLLFTVFIILISASFKGFLITTAIFVAVYLLSKLIQYAIINLQ